MPNPDAILENLTAIARGEPLIALLWHAVLAGVIVALALGWRPTRRTAATLLAAPLFSVGALAALYENAFNAVVFTGASAVLAALGLHLPRQSVERAAKASALAGASLIAFGGAYPHFIEAQSPFVYLYAAPTGLLPCPTLSAVIGMALLAGGFRARAWSTLLAALGLFYGLFGALSLGVVIDVALAAGALALLVATWGAVGSRRPATAR